jgi:hypothetical protein
MLTSSTAFGPGATSVDPEVFEGCIYAVVFQMQQNLYFQFLSHLRAIQKELQSREKLASLQRALALPAAAAAPPEAVFVPPSFEEVMADPIQLHELLSFAGRMYSQERVVFYVLIQDFRVSLVARIHSFGFIRSSLPLFSIVSHLPVLSSCQHCPFRLFLLLLSPRDAAGADGAGGAGQDGREDVCRVH